MEKHSETIDAITEFLFIGKEESALKTYELVIFLGNDDIEGNASTIKLLFDTGHITSKSTVILSGNVGLLNQGKEPEALRLFDAVVRLGVPKNIFILEKEATNTLENLKFSKSIAEGIKPIKEFSGILCVGRAFLTRRAKMCASACGYPADSIDFYGTVDKKGKNISSDSWWKNESAIKRVIEELKRIAEYSLKGDLSIK